MNEDIEGPGLGEERYGVGHTERSALLLSLSRLSVAGVGFVATTMLARALGPTDFGRYAFVISALTFASSFAEFGYFASTARLLAHSVDAEERRRLLGGLVIVWAAASAMLSLAVALVSPLVAQAFHNRVGELLLPASLAAAAFMTPFYVEQGFKGAGKIKLLALYTFLSRTLFLVAIAVIWASGRLTPLAAVAAHAVLTMLVFAACVVAVRPTFAGLKGVLARLSAEQRSYGRHLFAGRLANLSTHNADRLLVAYFHGAVPMGHYSLASTFASAVAMLPSALAVSRFQSLAGDAPVPPALLRLNRRIALGMIPLALIATLLVVGVLLGPGYTPVAWLAVPTIIAFALQGLYQPYNSWLIVNGKGIELRRMLLIMAGINLAGNLALIPPFGAAGAAAASVISMGSYYILARRMYERALRAQS